MRILNIILKVVFALILLMPVLGATGVFPPPTRDLYNTDEAFNFILMLMEGGYLPLMNAFVCLLAFISLAMKRTLLAAFLALPITVNVIGFHAFLDGGLFTTGALLGNVMALINLYLVYLHKDEVQQLFLQDKG